MQNLRDCGFRTPAHSPVTSQWDYTCPYPRGLTYTTSFIYLILFPCPLRDESCSGMKPTGVGMEASRIQALMEGQGVLSSRAP